MGLPLSFCCKSLVIWFVSAFVYFYHHFAPTKKNELLVRTSHGLVEGGYTKTRGGRRVMQFLGIPYAKSPVNELSFKDPVEPEEWGGVRNAKAECKMCMQQFVMVEALRDKVIGQEDCLCVNVFTPNVTTSRKLPVIVFIHGGAYLGLSMAKSFYGPTMLLDKDVVLVTASYRLGVLGFLTTEDSVIPGNWGMKDQAAALRWVKANVHQFGGDPDSVTLMGEGSGAGSVHLHMLSPLTKDLFHRGVMQSGSGLCLWGFSEPGVLKERSKRVAQLIGCPFEPSDKFLECLQKTDAKAIVNTTREFLVWEDDPVFIWNPVVESADVTGAFLVQNPYTLTSSKPLLAGYNYAEGMFKISSLLAGDTNSINAKLNEWKREFFRITPVTLLYDTKAVDPASITTRIWQFYFGRWFGQWKWTARGREFFPQMDVMFETWPLFESLYLPEMIKMFGDFWFVNGLLDAVEKHSGPKFLYHFNYNTTASLCYNMYRTNLYRGACHSDELMYLFPMRVRVNNFVSKKSPDYALSLKMVELWTNFAADSVPTAGGITWSPVRTPDMEHLEITNSGFAMNTHPIADRRLFWKSLLS